MTKNSGKTLYVSDLDGTLLDASSQIPARSREMLNEAISAGALFSVATARTPATVSRLLDGINVSLPCIVMTGAAMWNPADGVYSGIRTIPPETVRRLLPIYARGKLAAFIYTLRDNIIDIYHPGPLDALERDFLEERIHNPYKRFVELCPGDNVPEANVLLFYSMQPDALARPVSEQVSKLDVTSYFYHDIFGPETAILEVFGPGTSKADAVRRLAADTGADRVVAFGDNINDLPMLRVADVSVAVENAVPEVKREADIVIGPNTSGAVPEFILQDMGIRS